MYNCVLDACVCAGDPARARELTTTMREKFGRLGKVSYNTILKGITLSGEIAGTWCSHLALRLAAVAAARQPQTGVKIT